MITYGVWKRVDPPPPLDQDLSQVQVTIYMGFISFMILIWDHVVTFADEVEYIWKGRKGLFCLFLLNRYLTPLGFIINLFAYMSPSWTQERCEHFVRYEGSMTVTGINTTALMMLIRIAALYNRKPVVIAFVTVCFGIELGVNAWLLTHGTAVIHNRSIHACTMIFDDSVKGIASASAWLPLTYDTIVLLLTLRRTLGPIRRKTAGKIAKVLLRDGILYYTVIFSVNFVLTVMIAAAPPGIQNITAQLEYLLTVAMMSRITLHLRKQVRSRDEDNALVSFFPSSLSASNLRDRIRFTHSHVRSTAGTGEVSVIVDQTSVIHDDHGNILKQPEAHAKKNATIEEWYELRSPPAVRINTHTKCTFPENGETDVRLFN